MLGLAKKIFGSSNDRQVKAMMGRVAAINALEPAYAALSDADLRGKTEEFKAQFAAGKSLDELLPDAFAAVREAARRTLGQRHYDVQLVGGMVLHKGGIAEMRTGEGKTLVATAPVYLNALAGKGVHLITVNDYLATRDAEWMGQVYRFLGLSVGVIVNGLSQPERQKAYASDITYGTNNEFGFDYLRDNLVYDPREMVQRGHHFAVVDEVDSILIDEARTPLIISGPTEDRSDFYRTIDTLVKQLIAKGPENYDLDEKQRQVMVSEVGSERVEEMLEAGGHLADGFRGPVRPGQHLGGAPHQPGAAGQHPLSARQGLHHPRRRDHADRRVHRPDDDRPAAVGGPAPGDRGQGRRGDPAREPDPRLGHHPELFPPLLQAVGHDRHGRHRGAGIPRHLQDGRGRDSDQPPHHARIDDDDEVYRTAAEKNQAIISQIEDCHRRGQPILVGTVSIEKSEQLSELLKAHKFENDGKKKTSASRTRCSTPAITSRKPIIVADAGVPGSVTIATNMAGRGTDIQLGGNIDMRVLAWRQEQRGLGVEVTPEMAAARQKELEAEIADAKAAALAAGGLFVLGTERHESRRIDNQLRGRTGRQGDPGHSKFFLSCEDDLLRIFAGERLDSIMRTFGVAEGEAITHKWLNSAIATAQRKVEQRNYEIRKNLLKYDDVVNDQRKAVFEQRQEFMEASDLSEIVAEMRRDTVIDLVDRHLPPKAYVEQWDIAGLDERVRALLGLELPLADWAQEDGIANEEFVQRITAAGDARAAERQQMLGEEYMRQIEKNFLLQMVDLQWREHLMHLDHLRNVIGLRGYGQRDPLNEYKTEAFSLFEKLLVDLRQNVTRWLMTVEFHFQEPEIAPPPPRGGLVEEHMDPLTGQNEMAGRFAQALPDGLSAEQRQALPLSALPAGWERTSRNAPCPCGSGKKFKHCHGALV